MQGRPATLPPLDLIGLEPVDHSHAMSRGGSGTRSDQVHFKLQMLTERIMHECVKKLLGNVDNLEIESLCKLLATISGMLDFTS